MGASPAGVLRLQAATITAAEITHIGPPGADGVSQRTRSHPGTRRARRTRDVPTTIRPRRSPRPSSGASPSARPSRRAAPSGPDRPSAAPPRNRAGRAGSDVPFIAERGDDAHPNACRHPHNQRHQRGGTPGRRDVEPEEIAALAVTRAHPRRYHGPRFGPAAVDQPGCVGREDRGEALAWVVGTRSATDRSAACAPGRAHSRTRDARAPRRARSPPHRRPGAATGAGSAPRARRRSAGPARRRAAPRGAPHDRVRRGGPGVGAAHRVSGNLGQALGRPIGRSGEGAGDRLPVQRINVARVPVRDAPVLSDLLPGRRPSESGRPARRPARRRRRAAVVRFAGGRHAEAGLGGGAGGLAAGVTTEEGNVVDALDDDERVRVIASGPATLRTWRGEAGQGPHDPGAREARRVVGRGAEKSAWNRSRSGIPERSRVG